jgi:hypothetical protein
MKINRHNYEAYAIDFIEGKMSPSVAAAFIAFLTDNPDIAHEVELLRDFGTDTGIPPIHQDFSFLRKDCNSLTLNSDNFEELCIAYHEGDLNENMQNKVIEYIQDNQERQKIFNVYRQLKILPDERITYRPKSSLKQKKTVWLNSRRIALISTMAAAASFAMVLIYQINNSSIPASQNLAHSEENTIELVTEGLPGITEKQDIATQSVQNNVKLKQKDNQVQASKKALESNKTIIAAVTDSTDSEVIRLARIEPKPIQNINVSDLKALAFQNGIIVKPTPEGEQNTIEDLRDMTNSFVMRASQLSVNNIIKSGIKGLNNIAETDLSYKSQTDDKGRITEFALSSETFNIKRRIRNN